MKRTHDQLKIEHFTAGVLAIAGCFLMVAFPRVTQSGVSAGLDLFLGSVLPTLFPFFILANFLGLTAVPDRIGRLFEPLFQRLFRVGGQGAYVAMVSLFSGYPMAAKLVGEACRSGILSPLGGKKILSFSSVCGPLFMVGTVGTAMLGNPLYGLLISAGHYAGAICNGVLFSRVIFPETTSVIRGAAVHSRSAKRQTMSVFGALSDSILRAFCSMGLICGYIILFSVLSEFLKRVNMFLHLNQTWIRVFLSGCMEMTLGCTEVANCTELPMGLRLALCSAFLGFGGGSIAGQSLSMLADSGIDPGYYLRMKLCHGWFAGLLTYGFSVLGTNFGLFDVAVGVVYGTDLAWLHQLGMIHQRIFGASSMALVLVLMGALIGIDQLVYGSYHKIHTYIVERRKNDR